MVPVHPSTRPIQTVSLLGSYVPRQCGIATFTKDLRDALAGHIGDGAGVVAMDDGIEKYAYPNEVAYQINQQRVGDYAVAAETLNEQQIDAVVIQHEYGIFGGRDGSHVLNFARRLRMPLVATLHTVLTEPSPTQKSTLKELTRLCDRVVVMSQRAQDILEGPVWQVPKGKVAYIPHGIPDVPFVDPHYYSNEFNTVGRRVLLTFGLLGPGKGIETALRALPAVIAKHPDVLYIILGATHPHVLRHEGNRYRESLEKLIAELGLQNHVRFDNKYVSTPELMKYLGVTDVYVIPYPNPAQITSGTLAYAVGAGKAVVSTPFWHAEELLSDGRGLLFPFNDPNALANQINELLDKPDVRHNVRRHAYDYARPMVWKDVAGQYLDIIRDAVAERRNGRSVVALLRGDQPETTNIKLDFSHVARLSDDTGILQHAIHATPDRRHGYCTDDNARALIAALMQAHRTGDEQALALSDRYMSFLHYALNENTGRFRNFMHYDRRWLENVGSEDSHGRAVWALGFAVRSALTGTTRALACRLLRIAMPATLHFTSPRTWAFTIIGLSHHLHYYAGDTAAARQLSQLADKLFALFQKNAGADWPWLEDVVTYDNAKLCHALLLAGEQLDRPEMVQQALASLEWLLKLQVDAEGTVSLIGNDGWLHRDGRRARFDQQPVEAMALVEACVEAARVTGESSWIDQARTVLGWFTGANELGVNLVDPDTAGCCDGLHTAGVNYNQGAESTLAWVIAGLTFANATKDDASLLTAERLKGDIAATSLNVAADVRGLL
ncbi:MAG: glycosyltransferase family 4 protein [Tepidisphaeraceae bacterium]